MPARWRRLIRHSWIWRLESVGKSGTATRVCLHSQPLLAWALRCARISAEPHRGRMRDVCLQFAGSDTKLPCLNREQRIWYVLSAAGAQPRSWSTSWSAVAFWGCRPGWHHLREDSANCFADGRGRNRGNCRLLGGSCLSLQRKWRPLPLKSHLAVWLAYKQDGSTGCRDWHRRQQMPIFFQTISPSFGRV